MTRGLNRTALCLFAFAALLFVFTPIAFASEAATGGEASHGAPMAILWVAIILLVAKFSGLVERWKQPAVMGELVAGVVLGNLVLIGITFFEPAKTDVLLAFLSRLGVMLLLFQVGLESNIQQMLKVGWKAFLVACVGVAAPFALGYYVGALLLPGLPTEAYIFLGATLTATSVGITARVFKDLGKLDTPEAKVIIGAAVIDDVIGLVILAAVSALVQFGSVSLGTIGGIGLKALLFLVGAIVIGKFAAPRIGSLLSRIHTGTGMKITFATSFWLVLSWLAGQIGLDPIVGAFAAGLVLDPVDFKTFREPELVEEIKEAITTAPVPTRQSVEKILEVHSHHHVESLMKPLEFFLVPIFFVMTGMAVDIRTLLDPKVLGVALAITLVAFIGKLVSGFAAGKIKKLVVGFGMVPRGEVGLIFAAVGRGLGVITPEVYSIIVIVVILTTLLTPPILSYLLRREEKQGKIVPEVFAA